MLTTLLIGLSIGMLLVLIAGGLSLIFGMLGVVNFAHGALYMLGAFVALAVAKATGSFWIGLLVSPFVVAALGATIELGLLRPLYARGHEQQLQMTFGLILVIEEGARLLWGMDFYTATAPGAFVEPLNWLGEKLPAYRVFVVLAGLAVAIGLYVVIETTRLGMVLRAAMSNAQMVRAMGIAVSRYRTLVFACGAGLAALGGAIAAPMLPVHTAMGYQVIIDSFVVVILGGLGNVRGAILAALLLGQVRAFGQLNAPEWVDVTVYALLALTLLFRPQGLFSSSAARQA